MNRFLIFSLLISLTFAACTGTKKLTLERDLQSQQMITQGNDLMSTGAFEKAADVFETASIRPKNQSTTTAIYLSGLAHFKRDAAFPAQQQFEKLIREYPKSKYVEDARYHLALIKLKKYDENVRFEGIKELFALADHSKDNELETLARNAALDYLFNHASLPFLTKFYNEAAEPLKTNALEAIIHQEGKKGKPQDALIARYQAHIDAGGRKSVFLENLLAETAVEKPIHEPKIIKLALMMPFYLDEQNFFLMDEIPRQSRDALEFYEGFQQAIEDYSPQAQKKIFLEVFDTKRDTSLIKKQLRKIQDWSPDMVIGDVFTTESRAIAQWANAHKVVQMVPFSANPSLINDSLSYTFLARPSVSTHGKAMATYAAQGLLLQHVVVWTDGRSITNSIANRFAETFQAYGGQVTLVQIDSIYDHRAQKDIQALFRNELRNLDGIDGMYIPLSNEESVGLIISSLSIQVNNQSIKVMGTPSWQNFNLIPRQLKERFEVIFTSPYAEESEPLAYSAYVNKHYQKFGMPPSEVNVQGYGLGMYVLNLLDIYNPTTISLKDFIKNAELFKAAHSDIFFMRNQDNQELHLFEFRDGVVVRVK
jgi:hypothetical protein